MGTKLNTNDLLGSDMQIKHYFKKIHKVSTKELIKERLNLNNKLKGIEYDNPLFFIGNMAYGDINNVINKIPFGGADYFYDPVRGRHNGKD